MGDMSSMMGGAGGDFGGIDFSKLGGGAGLGGEADEEEEDDEEEEEEVPGLEAADEDASASKATPKITEVK
jgi:hypothetical protein